MRTHRLHILTVLLSGLLLIASCQQKQITTDVVHSTLDSLEHKLEWLEYRSARERWDFYTTGHADSLEFFVRLQNAVVSDPHAFDALSRGKSLLKDETDQRRRRLLHETLLLARIETQPRVAALRDSLSDIDIKYRAEFEGEPCEANYLYRTYRTDDSRVRRETAYRAWCSVGAELADGLERLIRLRNQQARREGYNSYLAMAFGSQGIDTSQYLALLERLDEASAEPYWLVLENSKAALRIDQPEVWDLAFAFADISRAVDSYFPVDSQLRYVRRSLRGIGYDLDKMPIYFDLDSRPDKSQFAYAFTIKPPYDMRVLANLTDGLYSTRILMHEIGHAIHSAGIVQERPLFRSSLDGSWSEGMAQTVAAMCDDSIWLAQYAHLPGALINEHLRAKHDQDISYLRLTLARLMFEYEAYSNPNRDLNTLYWDLFERYMQLPRHDDIKPWAAIIHYTTHPVYLQNYLYGDIVAAQTVRFLSHQYGGFIDNRMTSSFLSQNYFRFGSRYDWRELLERGTNEPLNADYLMAGLNL